MSTEIKKRETTNQIEHSNHYSINYRKPHYRSVKTEDGYNLEVELPGFSKEAVSLLIEDDIFQVTTTESGKSEKKGETILRERSNDPYRLDLKLPKEIDQSKVKASVKNGLLSLQLVKKEYLQARKVTIQ